VDPKKSHRRGFRCAAARFKSGRVKSGERLEISHAGLKHICDEVPSAGAAQMPTMG
jgi:hypothetical protein